MHFVFACRGINQQVDLWKKFLETQMFLFPQIPLLKDDKGNFIKNEDGSFKRGTPTMTKVQGALRPIQLYEYVFPKDSLPEVLALFGTYNKDVLEKQRPEVNTPIWLLRKMMKLNKVPIIPEIQGKQPWEITGRYVPGEAVAIYPIGIKDDVVKDFFFKDVGFYQEGL